MAVAVLLTIVRVACMHTPTLTIVRSHLFVSASLMAIALGCRALCTNHNDSSEGGAP